MKLTEDILRTKLKNWTLCSHLEKTLNNGMSNDEIKKQLAFFVSCGLIEKSGERRGIKYKYKQNNSIITDLAQLSGNDIEEDDVKEDTLLSETPEQYNARHSLKEYEKEKTKNKESIALLGQLDVFKFLNWLNNQSVTESSSISSFTVSFKKTRDNAIQIRIYSGITILQEVEVSSAKFKTLLSKLDTSNKERKETFV